VIWSSPGAEIGSFVRIVRRGPAELGGERVHEPPDLRVHRYDRGNPAGAAMRRAPREAGLSCEDSLCRGFTTLDSAILKCGDRPQTIELPLAV
jgi:hypothetical protein